METISWKNDLLSTMGTVLRRAETQFDQLKHQLRQQLGRRGPVQIQAFRGFGSVQHVELAGRVLEEKALASPLSSTDWWQSLLAVYHRLESEVLPGVTIRGELQGQACETISDDDGYFQLSFDLPDPLPDNQWHEVHLQLLDQPDHVWETGHVMVPPQQAEYGIISDIDDTILQKDATDWLRMVRVVLRDRLQSQLPFAGIAEFHQALVAGSDGDHNNPVFYLSGSAWEMYDLLSDYFDHHGVPRGPLLLGEMGLDKHRLLVGDANHKSAQLDRILSTYPHLPFVLLGDSEGDTQLYFEAAQRHPGRIREIYLRDTSQPRREATRKVLTDAAAKGIEMVLTADAGAAAEHARQRHLVQESSMQRVVERCR